MRRICIFHADDTLRALEAFNNALEIAVAVRCLGPGQFVGRSQSAGHFQEYLREVGVAEQDELHGLLEKLALRGFVVGYGFANGDGIHGWLTPDETVELNTRLERLPLPRYAATFEVMQERFRQDQERYPRQPPFSFTPEDLAKADLEWLALGLSFVRTVAAIAMQSGRGVLWANDLTVYRGGNGSSSEK
jgi:hypothetical protein